MCSRHAEPASVLATPMEIEPVDAEERAKAAGRRGTQDLGLLLLRVAVGAVFIAHGLQKAFGWWGGQGIDGFKTALADAGYQHAGVLTYVGAGAQIVVGVLLVLGLFTPLAAAGALAYLVNSLLTVFSAQRQDGYLSVFGADGIEYLLVLIVAAASIILVGPGRYGFDAGRGWARRPFVGSFIALILGIGGGVAAWVFLHGNNPLGSRATHSYGLGTRPPLAAVSSGNVANVTAGSRNSDPSLQPGPRPGALGEAQPVDVVPRAPSGCPTECAR